ncbi:MAG TPA: hypothetical protein VI197_06340 [Polyangiaceae bacterium]
MTPLDPSGWCFLVLTLDRDGYRSGKPWSDVNAAYRALARMTRITLKRIGRQWGPDTRVETSTRKLKNGRTSVRTRHVRYLGNRWYSVVEAHRSGWPHMNLVVWCPELAEMLRREHAARMEDPEVADAVALARDAWKTREPIPEGARERARRATVIGGPLAELLTDAGWGYQSTAETPRDLEAVLAYGVKLVGMHDAAIGEVAKVTQCPMNAPERFRRLRAGKGFLPPRQKNEAVTGCLVRRRRSREGDWEIQAINAPKDDAQVEPIMRARAAELQLIEEEEGILSRSRGRMPAMPPMRLAVAGKLESHKHTSERRAAIGRRMMAAAG